MPLQQPRLPIFSAGFLPALLVTEYRYGAAITHIDEGRSVIWRAPSSAFFFAAPLRYAICAPHPNTTPSCRRFFRR